MTRRFGWRQVLLSLATLWLAGCGSLARVHPTPLAVMAPSVSPAAPVATSYPLPPSLVTGYPVPPTPALVRGYPLLSPPAPPTSPSPSTALVDTCQAAPGVWPTPLTVTPTPILPTRTPVPHAMPTATAVPSRDVSLIGQLGGIARAVAVQRPLAFLGVGRRVIVLDVLDVTRPRTIAETVLLPDDVQRLRLFERHLYVADGAGGLLIFDVSDPARPTLVGSEAGKHSANAVDVVGGHAYILGPAGLRILDVSDPRHPFQVGSYDIRYGEDIVVDGKRAYVSDGATLRILDVTDPRHSVLLGSPFAIGNAARIAVAGHYVYVADRGDARRQGNLRVVDVADPARPVQVGALPLSSPSAIAIAGRYVYVGLAGIVDLIDVSEPTHPRLVGSLRSVAGLPFDLVLDGGYTFVADGFGVALRIGDVTDPSNPRLIATLGVPTNAQDVAVANDYAYVADQTGLDVVSIAQGSDPVAVGFLELRGATSVAVSGSTAYVTDLTGLHVIDVADPTRPIERGSLRIQNPSGFGPSPRVVAAGPYTYVAAGNQGLFVVDVADPAQPRAIGLCRMPGHVVDAAVAGGHAYVAAGRAGLHVVDLSTPTAPREVGHVAMPSAGAVALSGRLLYVADGDLGLLIFDVSDPIHPREIGRYPIYGPFGVAASGDTVYVLSARDGLRVIDVRDPAHPVETGFYRLPPGFVGRAQIWGSEGFVAHQGTGLWILHVPTG